MPSSILESYTVLTAGVLTVAALLILWVGRRQPQSARGLWQTYRGWLVIAPLFLGTLWGGPRLTMACVTLVCLFAFKEFATATRLSQDRHLTWGCYGGILAMGASCLVDDPTYGGLGWYGLFMALPVYVICLLLAIPVLRNQAHGQLQRVSLGIVGFLYFGWMLGHLGMLARGEHFLGYVLFLVFAVELNDVAAFTFGKCFGRRKLCEHISPNKTWAGALGAFCVAMALPWLLGFSFPHFGATEKLLAGLIVGIGGQLGDLTISFIKRDLGVKDMGTLLPGHGGLLDRVDSLVFSAPLFFHMTHYFHG